MGAEDDDDVDITFTATRAANGALLIGSSRELAGWEVCCRLCRQRLAPLDH